MMGKSPALTVYLALLIFVSIANAFAYTPILLHATRPRVTSPTSILSTSSPSSPEPSPPSSSSPSSSSSASSTPSTSTKAECGPCPLAPKCSGEYRNKGLGFSCDGSGKIEGGIGTVPGMSWWPIKVYRPCPSYIAAGYQYRREGQTMDQVLFSEPSYKMQEKLKEMRKSEIEESRAKSLNKDMDETDKLLQKRFGGKGEEEE